MFVKDGKIGESGEKSEELKLPAPILGKDYRNVRLCFLVSVIHPDRPSETN